MPAFPIPLRAVPNHPYFFLVTTDRLPHLLRTFISFSTEDAKRLYGTFGAEDGRKRSISTKGAEC